MVKAKIKLSVILIVLLVCTTLNVNAADNKIFSVSDGQGYNNGEVTVYINLEKELDFASADLVLEYDTSKLEYVKYTSLTILDDAAMNIVKNNSDTGKVAIGYVSNPEEATIKKKPGQILSVTFRIKANESEETKLALRCTTLKNDAGDSIDVADVQSKITVIGKASSNTNTNTNSNNNSSNSQSNNYANDVNNPSGEVDSPLPYAGAKESKILIALFVLSVFSRHFYKKYIYLKKI